MINEVTVQSLYLRQLTQGPNNLTWCTSLTNDIGRLTQGVGTHMSCGTNTVFYVPKSSVPADRKVTYVHMVATILPHKTEVNRVRVTVGGNILD